MVAWMLGVVMLTIGAQSPTIVDRVLAVVNGEPVTQSDVRAVQLLALAPPEATDRAVVDLIIGRRLVRAELRRFQVAPPDNAVVAARVAAWRQRLDGDPASTFARAGVDLRFVEQWLIDEWREETYLQQRFAALAPERRSEAVRLWREGLRTRATISYRGSVPSRTTR